MFVSNNHFLPFIIDDALIKRPRAPSDVSVTSWSIVFRDVKVIT